MKEKINNLTLKSKIIIPLSAITIIFSLTLAWYFSITYKEARIEEHVAEARALLMSAESAREYAAAQFNKDVFRKDLKSIDEILYTVPVFAAIQVASLKADEVGVEFRVPKVSPRNPKNEPNAYELSVLKKLDNGMIKEFWEVDEEAKMLRYFRPIKLTQECMACHGEPSQSKALWGNDQGLDPTGAKMEGWKVGEVHGAFEITTKLDHVYGEINKKAGMIALICFISGLAIIGVGYYIANWISGPVREFALQADAVSKGDLRFKNTPLLEAKMDSGDELGQLARAFGGMINSLRDIIRRIDESSDTIASASTEISSSTEQMAAGAREQTNQAGEVASAVEQMTSTIVENSKNAAATADTAAKAKTAAEEGGRVVSETVVGMQRISEVVNKSAKTVMELGKSSDQIGEIISVIDDIADQTNLLALNAAIEAARAGEQGRGFAVVADEVRKLAERTTKATKEIADMIKKIQSETKGAVTAMNEGTKEVEHGITLAEDAGRSLKEIVAISQRVTEMVAQIATGSDQQAQAAEHISASIESITTVTQETATGANQVAQATEDLSRMTDNLHQMIKEFQLSERSTRTSGSHNSTQRSNVVVGENGTLTRHSTFDIGAAKTAHKLWRAKVGKLLRGHERLSEHEVPSHHDCKLGKWCDSDGMAVFGNDASFLELGKYHEEMHNQVRKVVKLYNDGKVDQAKEEAQKVYELSDTVVRLLDSLESVMA